VWTYQKMAAALAIRVFVKAVFLRFADCSRHQTQIISLSPAQRVNSMT
jgi:hypothetical protein